MAYLIVSGLNYHFSPICVREQIAIPKSCIQHALASLKQSSSITEAVLLSTCNRTEVYAVTSNLAKGFYELEKFFAMVQTISGHDVITPNFKLMQDDVVYHLLRVASSLDSMVLGESQILSQVKEAHQFSLQSKFCAKTLDYIFKLALECGKYVRSTTTLSKGNVSVASLAVEYAKGNLGDLTNKNILIVGNGTMARTCVRILLSSQVANKIKVACRNIESPNNCLKEYHDKLDIYTMQDLPKLVAESDLVIFATSSENFLLNATDLVKSNTNKSTYIVDLAVPRNVEPKICELDNFDLISVDDLNLLAQKNMQEREKIIVEVESIIADFIKEYKIWELNNEVIPTINRLRDKFEFARLNQVKKVQVNTESLTQNVHINETICKSLINTILHEPITHLKSLTSKETLITETSVLNRLFALDNLTGNTENS